MLSRLARYPVGIGLLIGSLLSACNLPVAVPAPVETTPVGLAHTVVAETIVAQLTDVNTGRTEVAGTPTGTGTATLIPTAVSLPTSTTGLPTSSPSPTTTPEDTPTPTITPTATLPESDPRAGLGTPTWQDSFDAVLNWAPYTDRYAQFDIHDGAMWMKAFEPGSRNAWLLSWPHPLDYYLEIEATPVDECSDRDRYGLIVRSDAISGYWFLFSCEGEYAFTAWDGDANQSMKLIDWTASEFIETGPDKTNRMGIRVQGDRFELFANGNRLEEVQDDRYSEGAFGLLVGAGATEEFTTRVDQVAYWELP